MYIHKCIKQYSIEIIFIKPKLICNLFSVQNVKCCFCLDYIIKPNVKTIVIIKKI